MRKYFVAVFLIFFSGFLTVFGQNNEISIPFLEKQPVIDGLPDTGLNISDWRSFFRIEKSSKQNKETEVRYKIGYNYTYLYLLIESNSDSIIYRDRAYQNGDGFHLVIAKPNAGKPTDEFYVARFSPTNLLKNQSGLKGIWYYNVDLSGKRFGPSTQFECNSASGKSYFELLLPWNDVYPYNPLFSDSLGFNMCFVKAIGDKEMNYYFVKYDNFIQGELHKRDYLYANFEKPKKPINSYSLTRLEKNNIQTGNNVQVNTVSFTPTNHSISYSFSLRSADNWTYANLTKEVQLSEGINANTFVLPLENISPGGYKVVWKCSDNSEGEIPLTVLPKIDFIKETSALATLKPSISQGDYNTILFMLQNIQRDYKKVKQYETAGSIRERFTAYRNNVEDLRMNHALTYSKSNSRRAFLSKIDTTLQPYSIKLPVDFDRHKKYPLFVMLHGSGSDDQDMLNGSLTENNFIEIAPYGRGTSNCFTSDGAQIDVKEAIDDVIKNFPVDTTRIILAGFSMGGYGAYRIFYEYPRLFKGVAVFSGHPKLASMWIGPGFPDFLDAKYLTPFKNIPVFIYHSKNDLNCPYELTQQLVEKLSNAGAKVEFVTTIDGGHGIIDTNNQPAYLKWLKNSVER